MQIFAFLYGLDGIMIQIMKIYTVFFSLAWVKPAIVHKWSVAVLKRTAINTILERLD